LVAAASLEILQLLTPDRNARILHAFQKIAGRPRASSPVASSQSGQVLVAGLIWSFSWSGDRTG
jgi:hypothetical protein